MAKISDFDFLHEAYSKNELVTTFKSNLWGEQETFRRMLGPESNIDSYKIYLVDTVIKIVDPINWAHPVCCNTCREEANTRIEQKNQKNKLV